MAGGLQIARYFQELQVTQQVRVRSAGFPTTLVYPDPEQFTGCRTKHDGRPRTIVEPDHQAVSNAVFHWILEPRPALAAVFQALRPGGRFVGEFGGEGNIASVIRILTPLLATKGIELAARNPIMTATSTSERGLAQDVAAFGRTA